MLTLLAYRTTWKPVELYEFEPVNLNYSFTDITKVNSPTSNYSQTFRVPLTKTNEDVFGPYDLSQVPSYDLKAKIPARLMEGGVAIMTGFIQVKGWYVQKGRFVDVELAFFGEQADLAKSIGEDLLSDLDWSSFDHSLTYTAVTNSWAGTLLSGQIRYGIVDKWRNWTSTTSPATTKLYPADCTPFIRIKSVLDKIFTTAGFTYESTHFSNLETTLYMMLHSGGKFNKFTTNFDFKFWVGRTTDLTITAPTTFTDVSYEENGNFYDTGADFVSPTWTVPLEGVYQLDFYFNFTLATAGATATFRLTNGTTHYTIASGLTSPTNTWFSLQVTLASTSTWKVQVQTSAGNITLLRGAANGILGLGGTSWKVGYGGFLSSITLDTARNFPKMRQVDFLAGLQKCFNLVFIPDKINPKKIYIEPFNDYMATGDVKDWTGKIDMSMDLSITPTSDLQRKRYVWTHSAGEDFVSQAIQASERVYGQHEILDPGNDFATGDEKIESGFAPFFTSYIPGTGYNIHRLLSSDPEKPEIDEVKPRLAFYKGQLTLPFLLDNAGTGTSNNFPFFGQFATNTKEDADVADDSLMFGIELPLFEITANPYDTLYNKYWQLYANQLYSSDARLLTAHFRLSTLDISTFEWSDKIYLFNTYWRILEISGYDPTSEGTVQVKLLKVLGTMRDCTYLPATGRTGKIEFTTSTGSGIFTVNRTCCERYGFVYDAATAYCYQP
jgi:hypothetical protein